MALEKRSLTELQMRRAMCEKFIAELKTIKDPRQAGALKEYRRQLASLNKQIGLWRRFILWIKGILPRKSRYVSQLVNQEPTTNKPAPTVVHLKTAVLFPKTEKGE